jgi:hypothetical protein
MTYTNTNTYTNMQPQHYTAEDRHATRTSFTEHLLDAMDGNGIFTVEDALQKTAKLDPPLEGLNPVWAQETLDEMVTEGSLLNLGDGQYRVID